jgi:hypothetical protein
MAQRFQTYFGIPVPPFKEEKIGAGSTTIRFVLTGKIVSKKNNQAAIATRWDAKNELHRIYKEKGHISLDDALKAIDLVKGQMIGNSEYRDTINEYRPVLEEQKAYWLERLGPKGLVFPLQKASMTLRFYFKSRHVTDTANKQQTIQDLLVECGVVANDDYKTLNPIYAASACYYEEFIYNIAFVSLSFKL